jgi:hypothetical protein
MTRYLPEPVAWPRMLAPVIGECDQEESGIPEAGFVTMLRSEPHLCGLSARVPTPVASALGHYLDLIMSSTLGAGPASICYQTLIKRRIKRFLNGLPAIMAACKGIEIPVGAIHSLVPRRKP